MNVEELTAVPSESRPAERADSLGWWPRLKYAVVRGFLWGWARCFSMRGLYLFGQFFGTCEYLINHKRRRRFRERLADVYGNDLAPATVRRMTWRQFTRIRCDKLFYVILDKLPREKILNRIRFHGKEIVDAALSRGHGTYIMISHHGTHHVSGLLLALLGYRVAGVRDRNEGALRRYVQEKYAQTFPEARAFRVLYADSFPRELFRCFEEGFILGSSPDIDHDRGSHLKTTPVEIFGQKRAFLSGPVRIALRCGAPVLQGFVISRKNFYFRLVVSGPLVDPAVSKDDAETLAATMQRYADNIEAFVREYPCHISKT